MFITPDSIAAEHQYRRERLINAYGRRGRRRRRRDRVRLVEDEPSRLTQGGSPPISVPASSLRSC